MNNRVNGVLAVTRALGDAYMKDLVTGHPYTTETVIQPDIDEFLILACDGVSQGSAAYKSAIANEFPALGRLLRPGSCRSRAKHSRSTSCCETIGGARFGKIFD